MAGALNGWLGVSLLVMVAGVVAEPAEAQEKKRVVVMEFRGSGASGVRANVVRALSARSEVEVVPVREAESSAKRLGTSLDAPEVAAELRVSAYIEGNVERKGKRVRAVVRVRNAKTSEVVHEKPWLLKKGRFKAIGDNFWTVMGPHILATEAPEAKREEPEPVVEAQPKAEPKPEVKEEVAQPEEPEDAKGESAVHPALVAWFGPRPMWRTLSYDNASELSSYKNEAGSPAFNITLFAEWFPAAHVRSDWLSDAGLEANIDYAIGLKSEEDGEERSTTAFELAGGFVYRIPLDTFEPRIRVGYVLHSFEVDNAATLPPVTYSALRFGAGTLLHLIEALSLDIQLAYLYVLNVGDLASSKFAPDATAKAFEAGAGATVRIKQVYGVRVGLDFRRYFIDFGESPTPGALPSTGTDDYLRATLAFVYTIPGKTAQKGQ